jgi:membrane associated rhomboid family serine protease
MEEIVKKVGRRGFDAIKSELVGVAVFIGIVWAVFLASGLLPLDKLALRPRELSGLPGVVTMPFLHGDLKHILSNTFPLLVLLTLLAGSRAKSWKIVAAILVGSGVLIWLLGPPGEYVGASALVFGLIGFLVAAGFLERRPVPLLIAIVVGVMYGWTAITGILPFDKQVSELSHFLGLVTGVGLAYIMSLNFDKEDARGPLEKLV